MLLNVLRELQQQCDPSDCDLADIERLEERLKDIAIEYSHDEGWPLAVFEAAAAVLIAKGVPVEDEQQDAPAESQEDTQQPSEQSSGRYHVLARHLNENFHRSFSDLDEAKAYVRSLCEGEDQEFHVELIDSQSKLKSPIYSYVKNWDQYDW